MNIIKWISGKYEQWKRSRRLKKKLDELRKHDPFIYKH
jgi:hypothetical protein